MDAIVLAGGKGTRMQPLTATTPKPLLKVQGLAIMEWTLLSLPKTINHIMVVVNYLGEQITAYMQQQHIVRNYTLVEQVPNPLGTGHAIQCCQPFLQSHEFLVVNGDDLYSATSLQMLAQQPLGILAATRDQASRWGVLIMSDNYQLSRIHEKPPEGTYPGSVLVNAGAYKMDRRIFDHQLLLSARNEYEITDYVTYLANIAEVNIVQSAFWYPVGTVNDLKHAQLLDLQTYIMA